MNGLIFINYRRSDSLGSTGRLYDQLAKHFGAEQIFIDVDTIDPGDDFVDAIERAVGKCDVLITVIGQEWLSMKDKSGRRMLDNPTDFVRLEIAAALKRKIRVIPVLVEDAEMPNPDDLPEDLKILTRRNAIELSHTRFILDVERLIKILQKTFDELNVQAKKEIEIQDNTILKEKRQQEDEGQKGSQDPLKEETKGPAYSSIPPDKKDNTSRNIFKKSNIIIASIILLIAAIIVIKVIPRNDDYEYETYTDSTSVDTSVVAPVDTTSATPVENVDSTATE